MGSGIVHHKSDRKSCVLPTADRNTESLGNNGKESSLLHQELLPSGVKRGFKACDTTALYI